MITANKGNTKIAGEVYDLVFEFNSIINALLEDAPEIVLGTITAWSNTMDEKLESVNKTHLGIVLHMSEDIIKMNKESEGDND